MLLTIIILMFIKVTCKRKLGLLVSLVIMVANFETIALLILIW